jgi:hypothetical protein
MRPITALDDLPEKDPNELIGDRFVCSGGTVLLAAPTGIGKSTFTSGMTYHFGAGLPYMGLRPIRPLRTWMIGAENDDHDQRDFIRGAEYQLRRDAGEEAVKLARSNLFFAMVNSLSGITLKNWLRDLLEQTPLEMRPDLLVLDPAFAYIGGDALQQADVSAFLRGMLNPILTDYKLGLILIHHTNKPKKDQGGPSTGSDYAYLGAGSAEFANWARAVLAIIPTSLEGVFELRAGKRGGRLGWATSSGSKTCKRYIAHSSEPGEPFFWRVATQEEIESLPQDRQNRKGRPTADVNALVNAASGLCTGLIGLSDLQVRIQSELGVGRDVSISVVNKLVADKILNKFKIGRQWKVEPARLI